VVAKTCKGAKRREQPRLVGSSAYQLVRLLKNFETFIVRGLFNLIFIVTEPMSQSSWFVSASAQHARRIMTYFVQNFPPREIA
jgi:hypothetical protein